ncbi:MULTISPECIES: enoyl-CoA hydratase/isomerase family protein [Bradyrhizobium]|jgi:2-(1,2-epoxy-1,2-dihydrophenyl)acetyl-CoA isomerase|uniref:enoyl-CoA hydratase/isomerase family protein n=1 Tax=Bradyrhizobium TaxID=374 RepID=UPI000419AC17|nr:MULTISPECIES: enoyl-CoA hydratase-related protein [Bradyrhizobium]RZN36516.1 enoyl-CoA hydratase [Bradyrhizobium sp. Leo121]
MTSELKTALGYECWVAEGPVLLDYADHVATLTLNRPESSNGMNIAMMQAIHEAVMRCHGDPRVRVVHVRGAGANFCAGGDVREFASKGEALGDFLRTVTAYLQMAVGGLIRLNATVVSEVQGYAAGGGGLGLVCASDLVVAAKSARFMAGATRVGMAPDGGASVILPRLVGFRRAAEIVLTNRVLGAEEAQAIGLINSIVPDDGLAGETRKLVGRLAANAPRASAAAKRLLWSGIGLSVESCLPEEARTVAELSSTADAREGLAAVLEKRTPNFTGA